MVVATLLVHLILFMASDISSRKSRSNCCNSSSLMLHVVQAFGPALLPTPATTFFFYGRRLIHHNHHNHHHNLYRQHHHHHHHRFALLDGQNHDDEQNDDDYNSDDNNDNSNNNNNNNSNNTVEQLRRLLEASWNQPAMGPVPSTPEAAAQAVAETFYSYYDWQQQKQATADTKTNTNNNNNIFRIDLHMPQYTSQDGRWYDPVQMLDFCQALAHEIALVQQQQQRQEEVSTTSSTTTFTTVIVRDTKTIETVERVWKARRQRDDAMNIDASIIQNDKKQNPDDNDNNEDKDDDDSILNDSVALPSSSSMDDVDMFRKQLDSAWKSSNKIDSVDQNDNDKAESMQSKKNQKDRPTAANTTSSSSLSSLSLSASSSSTFHLTSFFGHDDNHDNLLFNKPAQDLPTAVIQSLQSNLKMIPNNNSSSNRPEKNHQAVIMIVGAYSPAEMIAVRAVLQQYAAAAATAATSKAANTIFFLINCPLQPVPKEIMHAPILYSLRPIVARPTTTTTASTATTTSQPFKIVILRRYPADWQVYVSSLQDGLFTLVVTTPNEPNLQWVAQQVQQYLASKKQ